MGLIEKILERNEFRLHPPVLMDIGSSGDLKPEWKIIGRYSICIAFDADEREVQYLEHESTNFQKLIVFHRAAVEKRKRNATFYLTKSPYCSSLLEPDGAALEAYIFSPLFEVVRKLTLRGVSIREVLQKLDLGYIDWFKTDSQGTDLRLFRSIPKSIRERVLVAELEPGIIDAYRGEDKLWEVIARMGDEEFWLSDCVVKGTQRISREVVENALSLFHRRYLALSLKESPCWAELSYFNSFANRKALSIREFLLGWVFSTIKGQHGFALELANKGLWLFSDPVFQQMEEYSIRKLKVRFSKLAPYYFLKTIARLGRVISSAKKG